MRSEQLRHFVNYGLEQHSATATKVREREIIAEDVAAFLAAGGEIKRLPIVQRGAHTYQHGRETDAAARLKLAGSTPRQREFERGRANSRRAKR